MQDNILQVFVYGSLRKGFQHPAYAYISGYFSFVAEGTVHGALYDMGNFPAALPAQDGKIVGELYRIKEPAEMSWALAQLDDYEGLNTEAGETPLYRREPVEVTTENGVEQAWIYWYNGEANAYSRIDTGDMLEYLQRKNQNRS